MKYIIISFQKQKNTYFFLTTTMEWFVKVGWGERIRQLYEMNGHDAHVGRVMQRDYQTTLTKEMKIKYNIYPRTRNDMILPNFQTKEEAEIFINDIMIPLEKTRRTETAIKNIIK